MPDPGRTSLRSLGDQSRWIVTGAFTGAFLFAIANAALRPFWFDELLTFHLSRLGSPTEDLGRAGADRRRTTSPKLPPHSVFSGPAGRDRTCHSAAVTGGICDRYLCILSVDRGKNRRPVWRDRGGVSLDD